MEIKARLDKPFEKEDKINFITINNRQLSYEIRTTDNGLEAWGYTAEELEEREKQIRNNEIDEKIKELQEMSLQDILEGNKENIALYLSVINGLEMSRPE